MISVGTGEEGSSVTEESRVGGTDNDFWGNALDPRHENLLIVYNNANGLQIGDYLKHTIKNEVNRKTSKL